MSEPHKILTAEDAYTYYRKMQALEAEVVELRASVERHREWLAQKSNEKVEAINERDEARAWVRKLTAKDRILTCVYCGHAYPPGSPDHGASVLTEHIKVCTKHPLRDAERALATLRSALSDCTSSMNHAVTFIQTREKMHVAGVALFLAAKERAESLLAAHLTGDAKEGGTS